LHSLLQSAIGSLLSEIGGVSSGEKVFVLSHPIGVLFFQLLFASIVHCAVLVLQSVIVR
jgi:hypothetical protein